MFTKLYAKTIGIEIIIARNNQDAPLIQNAMIGPHPDSTFNKFLLLNTTQATRLETHAKWINRAIRNTATMDLYKFRLYYIIVIIITITVVRGY